MAKKGKDETKTPRTSCLTFRPVARRKKARILADTGSCSMTKVQDSVPSKNRIFGFCQATAYEQLIMIYITSLAGKDYERKTAGSMLIVFR